MRHGSVSSTMLKRHDGSMAQTGLGMPREQAPAHLAKKFPLDGVIIAVHPKGDPSNPHPILTVDVQVSMVEAGDIVYFHLPVYTSEPYRSGSITVGLPCLVWFKEGRRPAPFVFGFAAWEGDNVSSTLPGETRDYHQSGSMDRTNFEGSRASIAKGTFSILVESMDDESEAASGSVTLSATGAEMVKVFEGLVLKVYQDSKTTLAVGYGHQVLEGDNLALGDTITQLQADTFFSSKDVPKAESIVANAIIRVGRDPSTFAQAQQDALISLAYNIPEAFSDGTELMQAIAEKRDADVPSKIKQWRKSDGVVNKGLESRRGKEAHLFETGEYP